MSRRTMARSSSNMNSASARASSVLPTPVGPGKTNEPIGRFGSCSPVRALGLALQVVDEPRDLLDPVERRLLPLPARRERVAPLLQLGELLLERLPVLRTGRELDLELAHAALRLVELDRRRVDLHAEARRGLVDE